MKLFAEVISSVSDWKAYPQFLKNRKRRVFFYGFLLATLCYLLSTVLPIAKFQIETGGFVKIIDETVPDFSLKDGKLDVPEKVEIDESGLYFYINTRDYRIDGAAAREKLSGYQTALIADADHLIVKSNGQIQTLAFAELLDDIPITKKDFLEILGPYVTIVMVVVLVMLYLFSVAAFFGGALFTALLGMIAASMLRAQIPFGSLYQMSVYARTTPMLLKMLSAVFGFSIPGFFLLNFGISVAYLVGAIKAWKREQDNKPDLESIYG